MTTVEHEVGSLADDHYADRLLKADLLIDVLGQLPRVRAAALLAGFAGYAIDSLVEAVATSPLPDTPAATDLAALVTVVAPEPEGGE